MAIFRSIRSLSRNPSPRRSKSFFNLSSSSSSAATSSSPSIFPSPSLLLPHNHNFSRSPSLIYPLSRWMMMVPFRGPLFLSSPPWKLSQFSTPFYLQSDVVSLPKIQALSLLRNPKFPVNLRFESVSSAQPIFFTGAEEEKESRGGHGFVESWVNLPNMISMSRLLSGPLLGWMIVQEMYLPAFVGLALSGATDWLDGYVARKMGINSVVGSYLDPLADKVLIGCVALAMVDRDLLHSGLIGLVVLRDVALVGGAVYNRASSFDWKWKSWFDFVNLDGTHPHKVEPHFLSKVNTVFQLILVTVALLQPEFGTQETQSFITYMSWLVASTTVASTAAYGAQHLRSKSMLRKNLSSKL